MVIESRLVGPKVAGLNEGQRGTRMEGRDTCCGPFGHADTASGSATAGIDPADLGAAST